MPAPRDEDVVEKTHFQAFADLGHAASEVAILRTGHASAARVVVREDDPGGLATERGTEERARIERGPSARPALEDLAADDVARLVEEHGGEAFLLAESDLGAEPRRELLRIEADLPPRLLLMHQLPMDAGDEREQRRRMRSDAGEVHQIARIARKHAPERVPLQQTTRLRARVAAWRRVAQEQFQQVQRRRGIETAGENPLAQAAAMSGERGNDGGRTRTRVVFEHGAAKRNMGAKGCEHPIRPNSSAVIPRHWSVIAAATWTREARLGIFASSPMPFTYAHPALIVPFVRASDSRGWRSSLVLGAMSPDLARLIPVWGTRELSHSTTGLLCMDVPLAIALTLVWAAWFSPRASRLPGLEPMAHQWRKRSFLLIPLGAFVGALTHLGWDFFTHGAPIFQSPLLDKELFHLSCGPFRVRDANWFVHSFAGLAILGWGAFRLVLRSPRGLRSFLQPCWGRITLASLLPLTASLTWVNLDSPTFLKDLFTAVFRGGHGIPLLEVATLCFFAVFWWETRPSSALGRSLPPAA